MIKLGWAGVQAHFYEIWKFATIFNRISNGNFLTMSTTFSRSHCGRMIFDPDEIEFLTFMYLFLSSGIVIDLIECSMNSEIELDQYCYLWRRHLILILICEIFHKHLSHKVDWILEQHSGRLFTWLEKSLHFRFSQSSTDSMLKSSNWTEDPIDFDVVVSWWVFDLIRLNFFMNEELNRNWNEALVSFFRIDYLVCGSIREKKV